MTSKKHEVPQELLTHLLADYKKPEDLIGENGLLKQLTKVLVEKALEAELTEHLGHDRHAMAANAAGNTRNGKSKKTHKGELANCPSRFPEASTAASSHSLSPGTRPVGRGQRQEYLSVRPRDDRT